MHASDIRPRAFSRRVIGRLLVVNNILRPCIHKLDAVLKLEGGNIVYQGLHRNYERRVFTNNGGRCIRQFAEFYRVSMLDRHTNATNDVAHTEPLSSPPKGAFLLDNLSMPAAMGPSIMNGKTPLFKTYRPISSSKHKVTVG